eukprot:403360210
MFKRLHEIKPTYSMNKILGHTNHVSKSLKKRGQSVLQQQIGEIGKNMKFYDDHGIRRMDPLIIRDLQIRRSSRDRSRISNNLSSLNVTTKENTQTLEPDNSEFSKSTLITLPQENSGSALEQIINNTNFTSKKEQTSYNQFQSKDLTPKNFINVYQGSNNLSAIDQLASNLNLISHKTHQQNQTFNNSQFNNHTVRSGSTMRTRNAENIAKNHSTDRVYENINQKVTYPVLSSHFSSRNNYSSSRNNIGSYYNNIKMSISNGGAIDDNLNQFGNQKLNKSLLRIKDALDSTGMTSDSQNQYQNDYIIPVKLKKLPFEQIQ